MGRDLFTKNCSSPCKWKFVINKTPPWYKFRHGGRSLRSPPCQKSRTDTNRKSKQWTTPKPTQNNHIHDVVISNIKFHLNDISSQSETMSAKFGLAIYSSIHRKLLLSYRPWITRQVLNIFFLAIKDLNWIRKSYLCPLQLLSPPSTQRYLWRLNSVTVNEIHLHEFQQQHTQGLLKCAVYGLKYYGWATREKLYHSYPTTDTSLVPSHYETEPSASRI